MTKFYDEPLTDRRTYFHCNKAASGKKKLFKCDHDLLQRGVSGGRQLRPRHGY